MDLPLAERFARYADELQFENLPPEAVHEMKRRVIDSFACALGALHAEPAVIARKLAATTQSAIPATVIGSGVQTAPDYAAFANGVMIRYLDYNDTYLSLEPAHPSDNLAAVFAAAEAAGSDGQALITAGVLAYEIQCRLCDAASIRARGWDHVTYGAFSTSLAAGKLFGFDVERLVHAQTLAATPNNAMRQTRVGMLSHWKGCAFANASRNGLFAALLAHMGMTGPSDIFEGEMGFMKQVSGRFHVGQMGGDGEPFMINQTYIKYYPAEYHSQSAIDAALALRPKIGDVENIERITIETFNAAVEIIGGEPEKWRPTTRETADHSLPYCVAVALMEGDVTLESFDDAHLANEQLLGLVSRIEVKGDAELNKRYPEGIPNRLRIQLRSGEAHDYEVTFPRGHARNPMTDDEVEKKFRALAQPVLEENRIGQILDQCWNLEKVSSVGNLIGLLTVAKL